MAKRRRPYKSKLRTTQPEIGYAHREHRSKKGRTQDARNVMSRRYKKNKEKLKYDDYKNYN